MQFAPPSLSNVQRQFQFLVTIAVRGRGLYGEMEILSPCLRLIATSGVVEGLRLLSSRPQFRVQRSELQHSRRRRQRVAAPLCVSCISNSLSWWRCVAAVLSSQLSYIYVILR